MFDRKWTWRHLVLLAYLVTLLLFVFLLGKLLAICMVA